MAYSSLAEVIAEIRRKTDEIMDREPREIRAFRTGQLDNKAGSYGQYFGTWDIAAGMMRDYSMYTYYPLVQIIENPAISLDQFRFILDSFDHPYSNYLRYSGFPDMGHLAFALREQLRSTTSREEAAEAVRAFCAYTNKLAAWSFHYFPWGLGKQFTYENPEEPAPSIADPSRRVHIKDGRKIRLTWTPIGITVNAVLAVNENPELCRDIIDALPFTILQDHAVVTGESIYAWTPLISTAPIHVRERICDAPKGRLRFSQSTGQKLIVQYGPTTEDLAQPVLGEVIPEHAERLDAGRRRRLEKHFRDERPDLVEGRADLIAVAGLPCDWLEPGQPALVRKVARGGCTGRRRESHHETMTIARIDQADKGDEIAVAPCPSRDRHASRSFNDAQP